MVWTHYLSKKSLLVVVVVSGWQTKFNVSPDPDLRPGPVLDSLIEFDPMTVER